MTNYEPLSDIDKPLIELDCVELGLLIQYPSGVIYTNQTGGTACLHPWAEGVFLPINDKTNKLQFSLQSHFIGPKWVGTGATLGIDAEDAKIIDRILRKSRFTSFLSVDHALLDQSHEAWVHVVIGNHPNRFPRLPLHSSEPKADDLTYPIFGFGNAKGILTWLNSD